ncbi:MAG: deoxyhypusine synthase [Blastocatellia bacterium]|nr:MAG: deoxyhypusine synthase [Blastocatellia bacterium]
MGGLSAKWPSRLRERRLPRRQKATARQVRQSLWPDVKLFLPFRPTRPKARSSPLPHRAPGSSGHSRQFLTGKPIRYYRPRGSADIRHLIDEGFQAFNAGRLSEACQIFAEKMLSPDHDTTIGLTMAGALTPAGLGGCVIEMMDRGLVDFIISTGANLYHDLHYALNFTLRRGSPFVNDVELYDDGVIRIYDVLFPATVLLETDAYVREFIDRSGLDEPTSTAEFHYRLGRDLLDRYPGCQEHSVVARAALAGVPIYTSSPGDSSIGMNIAFHELMNGGRLMIDPNKDVNEVCAIVLAGERNGCVILGGGSPKNFYLQAQPTLWEVYRIPKGGNDYFIQITTDQVVWGGLSGATPSEAVSWGKINPGVLPDTVVAYSDSTIAFPLFCEYVLGSAHGRRPRKELVHKRRELVTKLTAEARAAHEKWLADTK